MAKAIQSFSLLAVFIIIMKNLINNKQFWDDLIMEYKIKHPFNQKRFKNYEKIINDVNFFKSVNAFLSKDYEFSLPKKVEVNKIATEKKRIVYIYNNFDDLFIRAINKYLIKHYSSLVSVACHSFQTGKGAKTAFKSIFSDKNFFKKDIVKLDIKNFYNSININDFFNKLPDEMKNNDLIFHYLSKILKNDKVIWNNQVVSDKKGLMAGISIAPFLTNLYLKDIDEYFVNHRVNYVRYSDDIIIFDYPDNLKKHLEFLNYKFNSINLELNKDKSNYFKSGDKWTFLGFMYDNGIIDISEHTVEKLKKKIKRLSKRYYLLYQKGKYNDIEILRMFINKLNTKFYGKDHELADLCWSRWFFPLINTSKTLSIIDKYVQNRLRFSVCGRYTKLNYKKIQYKTLQNANYKPLNSMYYLFTSNYEKFNKIIKTL